MEDATGAVICSNCEFGWFPIGTGAHGRCKGRNTTGRQCKGAGVEQRGGFCPFHDPKRDHTADRSAGGHAAQRKKRSRLDDPKAEPRKFETEADVLQLLGDTANAVATGAIDLRTAAEIRQICRDMLKVLQAPERDPGRTPPKVPTNGAAADGEADFIGNRIGAPRDGPDESEARQPVGTPQS